MNDVTYSLTDLPERMQSKIAVIEDCWAWTGAKNNKGYGSISNGRKGGTMLAHRMSYSLTKGDIPDGMQIDHRCRNISCVNPNHLDAVTAAENVRRRYHGITPRVGSTFSDIFQKYWGHAVTEKQDG